MRANKGVASIAAEQIIVSVSTIDYIIATKAHQEVTTTATCKKIVLS